MPSRKVFVLYLVFQLIAAVTVSQVKILENKGQYPEEAYFAGNLPGGRVFLQQTGLLYDFNDLNLHNHEADHGFESHTHESGKEAIAAHAYKVQFIDANPDVILRGKNKGNVPHNYFFGDMRVTDAFEYQEVWYENLYQGIDFRYYNYGETVKYDFIISPETDPTVIQMNYDALHEVFLDAKGNLQLVTSVNVVTETRPFAYQIVDGVKTPVLCEFQLNANTVSFILGAYDVCEELIIDPTLIFSTYSGSTADNWGNTATFDERGNLYSGGMTNHYQGGNFPATGGAYQIDAAGAWDVAIIKYDSLGTTALYATYLGGSGSDIPQSLIVNDNNELYIMGVTGSTDFPTENAFQSQLRQGGQSFPFGNTAGNPLYPSGSDIFISRLSNGGSVLLGSTFIGGSGVDGLMNRLEPLTANYGDQSRGDIFIRTNGNVMVASKTSSSDFPLQNPEQTLYGGGEADAVVFEMSPELNQMIYSSYLGGIGMDAAYSLKEDSQGNIFLAGGTTSDSLTQASLNFGGELVGDVDGWLAKLNMSSYRLDTGIYVGTEAYDQVYFVDVDPDNAVFIYGQTSGNLPVTGGVFTSGSGQFIQKWSPNLDELLLATRFGSNSSTPDILPTAFLVNECDNIYLSGWGGNTNSTANNYIGGSTNGLPITSDAFQSTTQGSDFYLMTLSADLSNLLYATYLGGTTSATHVDGGTSRFDSRGIVYHAVCAGCGGNSDFPTSQNAFSTTNNSTNCNNAAFKFDLATLRARIQTNSVSLDQPNLRTVCFPDEIVFQNRSIGGVDFEWNLGDGTELFLSDTTSFAHQYQNAGLYRVSLRAIDPNTCVGQDVTSVDVRVSKPIFDVSDDSNVCIGDDVRLFAFGADEVTWFTQDGEILSREFSPTFQPTEDFKIYVRLEDFLGCNELDSVSVTVLNEVDLNYTLSKSIDCFSGPNFALRNTSEAEVTYTWLLGDGNTSNERELIYTYEQDGQYTITLQAETAFCTYTVSEVVEANTVKVPNVITPNGDEANDRFEIIAPGKVNLKIVNRWGRTVLEEEDYTNDWSGLGEPAGVYYYEAEIEGESTCKGWLHVLK